MAHRHLLDEEAIEKIKEYNCCLGKYRVLLSDGYYCFLEQIFDCPHQDRRYVKNINSSMLACKTNKQLPCQECDTYIKVKADSLVSTPATVSDNLNKAA